MSKGKISLKLGTLNPPCWITCVQPYVTYWYPWKIYRLPAKICLNYSDNSKFINVKKYVLFVGEQYQKKEVQNLYSPKSDGTSGYDICEKWCNNNINCGGFYFSNNTCHFVNGYDVTGCDLFYKKTSIISKKCNIYKYIHAINFYLIKNVKFNIN